MLAQRQTLLVMDDDGSRSAELPIEDRFRSVTTVGATTDSPTRTIVPATINAGTTTTDVPELKVVSDQTVFKIDDKILPLAPTPQKDADTDTDAGTDVDSGNNNTGNNNGNVNMNAGEAESTECPCRKYIIPVLIIAAVIVAYIIYKKHIKK